MGTREEGKIGGIITLLKAHEIHDTFTKKIKIKSFKIDWIT